MTQTNAEQLAPIDLPYFQPRSDQAQAASLPVTRLPQQVIDVFYLRPTQEAPPQLVVVLGCLLGGLVQVATAATLETLPAEIRTQLQTLQISQRGLFRTITAHELYIFTDEAIEQATDATGFNDAITLFGRIQAKLQVEPAQIALAPLTCEGRLTVGRLDLLSAYRLSLLSAFRVPQSQNETMYHSPYALTPDEANPCAGCQPSSYTWEQNLRKAALCKVSKVSDTPRDQVMGRWRLAHRHRCWRSTRRLTRRL